MRPTPGVHVRSPDVRIKKRLGIVPYLLHTLNHSLVAEKAEARVINLDVSYYDSEGRSFV